MSEAEVILLSEVSKVYPMGGEIVHALRGVSLRILAGEYVAIVGPSGSGKSTMMNVIGCLDSPSSGRYALDGVDVGGMSENQLADVRNQRIGFVFQTFHLLPRLTAAENIELPLIYAGLPAKERKARVERRLAEVGLVPRRHHRPSELSGGQRQRVAIARALVTEPAILLADEPTGNLDQTTGQEILALFDEIHRAAQTIILVTHDPTIAERARRVVEIRDGHITRDHPSSGASAAA
jgi:putative ABC transport system ATP-binding protein